MKTGASGWFYYKENCYDARSHERKILTGINNKKYQIKFMKFVNPTKFTINSMFHRAFFNSIIDKYQHTHFFTFNTVLV